MGRAYHPENMIQFKGVFTASLGKPEDPVAQVFKDYCIYKGQTFSETTRNIITYFFVKKGFLEDSGVDNDVFLRANEGVFTSKYYKFREQVEQTRVEQLKRIEKKKRLKKIENKKVSDDTAFD